MTLWEMYSFGQLPYGEMSGGEVSGRAINGTTVRHVAICNNVALPATSQFVHLETFSLNFSRSLFAFYVYNLVPFWFILTFLLTINHLVPRNDQYVKSPYSFNTLSRRQVMRI